MAYKRKTAQNFFVLHTTCNRDFLSLVSVSVNLSMATAAVELH